MTSYGTVVSYPIPPYSNPPIEPQFYQPSRFAISAVALGTNTVVTTSVVHNYVIGQQVRLLIPQNFGCTQLNEVVGYVLSIPTNTQVSLSIDSTQNVNAFTTPATASTVAQIVAIGDINSGITGYPVMVNSNTNIPGSFINIS